MKSILTTAGIVAVGVVGLQGQDAATKPWNVSAALRGFYDDNYATSPKATARDSFGFEISPRASYNPKLSDLTTLSLNYAYSMKYYEDRTSDTADHSHEANLALRHTFTREHTVMLSDSFAVAQEAEIIDPMLRTRKLRANGNNYRNHALLDGTAVVSEKFKVQASYSNTIYDYQDEGAQSYSTTLDRVEQMAMLSLRWKAMEKTDAIVAYQYGDVGYTSKDILIAGTTLTPELRDSRSHYFFAGVDHTINENLNGSARAGVVYTDYVNALPGGTQETWSPYADANLRWTYREGSTLQAGAKLTRTPTDLTGTSATDLTLDQQSMTLYGAINHKVTPSIMASLNGMMQNSEFEGGVLDGDNEQMYMLGLNVNYQINTFLSAETGYSFDRLDSNVQARSFTRSRVFIGIRGTY